MKRQLFTWFVLAGWCLLAAGSATAGSVDDALKGTTMISIARDSGALVRYDFAKERAVTVGTVRQGDGPAMTGIAAAAYFPGFTNLYAFWANPADGKNQLVYVDVTTASGRVVAGDVEGGKLTGAAALHANNAYTVYAIQQAKIRPPSTIRGLCNINPNNSPHNEFSCTTGTGAVFTRDNLHAVNNLPADGTYYQGAATRLHVKPKGNGNQNGLIIDGKVYDLQNSNTYTFSGNMVLRVFNDKPKNGKGMGHWWVQVISGEIYINGVAEVLFPNRLTTVDVKIGTVNEIASLNQAYTGLATTDGTTFYSAVGKDLYQIVVDPVTGAATETKLATTTLQSITALQITGGVLLAYDAAAGAVAALQPATGAQVGTPANLGLGPVNAITVTPTNKDPNLLSAKAYD